MASTYRTREYHLSQLPPFCVEGNVAPCEGEDDTPCGTEDVSCGTGDVWCGTEDVVPCTGEDVCAEDDTVDVFADISGPVSEEEEDTKGAFVLYGHFVPIHLMPAGTGASGNYVIEFSSETFAVYASNRTTRVYSGDEFSANTNTLLYVKGLSADLAPCRGQSINISYMSSLEGSDHPEAVQRKSDSIKINVSEVQIEVNNTADDNDDIILVGDKVPVRARIFPWWPEDLTVTVTSEGEGKALLAKTGSSAYSNRVSVTLPRTSEWVQVYATGKEGSCSTAWDDTYLVAHASPQEAGPRQRFCEPVPKIINPIVQGNKEISTPVTQPYNPDTRTGGTGNEFTYSKDPTGVLKIPVRIEASVLDPRVYGLLARVTMVQIDAIGNSQLSWEQALDKGHPQVGIPRYVEGEGGEAGYFEAVATFTGLPANNSDFGRKTVTVTVFSTQQVVCPIPVFTISQQKRDFEVFFPKEATNHPCQAGDQADAPNWFYYWGQDVPPCAPVTRIYVDRDEGLVLGRLYPRQNVTEIYTKAGSSYSECIETLVHENRHVHDFFVEVWGGNPVNWLLDRDDDTLRDSWEEAHDGYDEWGNPLPPGVEDVVVPFHPSRDQDEKDFKSWTEGNAEDAEASYRVDLLRDWSDTGCQHGP